MAEGFQLRQPKSALKMAVILQSKAEISESRDMQRQLFVLDEPVVTYATGLSG